VTLTITHTFVSGKPQGADPTRVYGPQWDAAHTVTGNLPASQLNNGTGASSLTFWRGDETWGTPTGTPAGSNTQVQYNNAGLFAGISGATTDGTVLTLTAPVLGTPASGTLTNCTGLPLSTGISGSGTGVLTALGVNVGSAGSIVINGGALGTPSSGTLTNATGLPISTGISGLGTGIATFLATPSSANLRSALTDETGTGAAVFATSPTLTTPALGTPSSGTLTSCTGLPISSGVSGLGTNVATFLGTPSSANLAAALTDETGSGAAVFGTSPTLTTPNIVGITSGGNVAAGSVGEYIESDITSGSAVSLTTNTAANVTSISLTAGDWDVSGAVVFSPAGGAAPTFLAGTTNTTSATLPTAPNKGAYNGYNLAFTANLAQIMSFAARRYNVSSTTTVYLIAYATFGSGTCGAYGTIRARRII